MLLEVCQANYTWEYPTRALLWDEEDQEDTCLLCQDGDAVRSDTSPSHLLPPSLAILVDTPTHQQCRSGGTGIMWEEMPNRCFWTKRIQRRDSNERLPPRFSEGWGQVTLTMASVVVAVVVIEGAY